MKRRQKIVNEVIVGAAIVAAIVVSIYGYVFLRDIPVRQRGYHVYMIFDDITGLERGDAVTVSGLKVGRVVEMKLDDGHVRVKAWLNGDIPFPRDSRAAIRSIGMIGEKYIDLQLGHSDELLREGDVIRGEYINDIADMGGPVSELITQLNMLLSKFNIAMDSAFGQETQRHFAETLRHTRDLSLQMERALEQNLRQINNVIANLDTLTGALKSYWQRNEVALDSTTSNVAEMASQLRTTLTRLDSILVDTQAMLDEINTQNGAVGKAIYNDELYTRLNETLQQAQAILDEVKRNPGKYLQMSIIRLF